MADIAGGKLAGSIGGRLMSIGIILTAAGAGAAFTAFMHPSLQSIRAIENPRNEDASIYQLVDEESKEHVLPLESVIVNIESAERSWVRLDSYVSFRVLPPKDQQALLLRQMSEDLLSFLRSSPLAQLETMAGFEFLREDLSELVRIRSKGRAQRLILKSLVVE